MIKIKNKFSFRNRLTFGKLFYNDKFVIVFSVFLAFMLWVYAVGTSSETENFLISGIKVEPPKLIDNLQVFGLDDSTTASVRVSGNALVVQSLTAGDIYISASNTDELSETGAKKMKLSAQKSGLKTDYTFSSSVTPSEISVYVDRLGNSTFTIENKVTASNYDGKSYMLGDMVLSQEKVTVQGPQTIIDQIAKVSAEQDVDETLVKTTTVKDVPLKFYNSKDKEIDKTYLTFDITTVNVTIPVYKLTEVKVLPNIVNMPDSLDFDTESLVSVEPSFLQVALMDNTAEINEIYTEEIDFTKLNLSKNQFDVNLVIPSSLKNIAGVKTANVTFDMSDMSTKTLTVSKIDIIGQTSGNLKMVYTQSVDVVMIGPKSQISAIASSNVTGVVDMSESNSGDGQISEENVKFNINSKFSGCWVYGSYKVSVVPYTETSTASSDNSDDDTDNSDGENS